MFSSRQNLIDENLRSFADTLKAPDEYVHEERHLCDEICKLIGNNLEFVSELTIGGSIGKHTDVIAPDLDITIIVKPPHLPPFDNVFDDLKTLLILHSSRLQIRRNSVKRGTAALTFEFMNGISVDLVPATTLSREEVFSILRRDPSKSYGFGSTLVKDVMGFMNEQSSFVHSMVRLGKAWLKTLYFEEYFSGGSSIIELISVASALEEEKRSRSGKVEVSELCTLKRILDLVGKLDSLKLVFRKDGSGKWEGIWSNFRRDDFGHWEMSGRECFLIEPVNYFNDFLDGIKPSVLQKLKDFASVTRERLDSIMRGHGNYTIPVEGRESIQFHLMFAPQPSKLAEVYMYGIPTSYVIDHDHPCHSISHGVILRRNEFLENPSSHHVLKAIKQSLFWTVNFAVRGKEKENMFAHVGHGVDNLIKSTFQREVVKGWGSHEEFDVTLRIPYKIDGEFYCVRLSMKWRQRESCCVLM